MAIRWALLASNYRTDRMWRPELLTVAGIAITRLKFVLASESLAATDELISQIVVLLSDDLNTPAILNAIELWVQKSLAGATGGDLNQISAALDALLGIKF